MFTDFHQECWFFYTVHTTIHVILRVYDHTHAIYKMKIKSWAIFYAFYKKDIHILSVFVLF